MSGVDASALDDHHVLQHAFHHHPQEGHQDQVVQQTRHRHAHSGRLHVLKAGQEDEPSQQHGQGHVEDHLLRSALPPFPGYRVGGLFVCLVVVLRSSNMLVYLRDRSARRSLSAATLVGEVLKVAQSGSMKVRTQTWI